VRRALAAAGSLDAVATLTDPSVATRLAAALEAPDGGATVLGGGEGGPRFAPVRAVSLALPQEAPPPPPPVAVDPPAPAPPVSVGTRRPRRLAAPLGSAAGAAAALAAAGGAAWAVRRRRRRRVAQRR